MLGLVNLLEKTQLNDSQMSIIRDLKSCSSLVNTIIGDILDCSKIENGNIDIEKKKFHFRDTLISLARIQEIAAKEKNLHFETFISPDIPVCVIGDPTV
jgi:signal transduction histidine kinase